jgi:hypothetical protein
MSTNDCAHGRVYLSFWMKEENNLLFSLPAAWDVKQLKRWHL